MMLKIDDNDRKRIQEVIKFAEENEFSLEELMERANNPADCPGMDDKHNCELDSGYRVVYSVEQQLECKCKHISISLNEDLPSIEAAQLIMREFGMDDDFTKSHIYQEKWEGTKAINFIQPILED